MSTRKHFSRIRTVDDLNVVNDAQKADFAAMVEASGGALIEQCQSAYLKRWQEALVYIREGACLLDIGGGWPIERVWDAIVGKHKVDYHLIDIEPPLVEVARAWLPRYGLPPDNAVVGANTKLPFESSKFDIVFSSHCLEHSTDLEATFKEITRVLKSDGLMFFAVPFGFDDSDEHLLYLEIEDWLRAAEMAGFEVINYHIGQTYPMSGWDLCVIARRLENKCEWDDLRKLAAKLSKENKIFVTSSDEIFRFSGSVLNSGPHRILRQKGSRVSILADNLESILFLREPWSGIVELSTDKGERSPTLKSIFRRPRTSIGSTDLYSRIPYVSAIDLRDFSGLVHLTVAGQGCGKGEQAVLHGALLKGESPRA